MERYRLMNNAFCIWFGLVIVFSSCNNPNGTSSGRPVFDALKKSDSSESVGKDFLAKMVKSKEASKIAESLQVPRFTDAATKLGLRFSQFRDAVPDRYFFPEVMGSGLAWIDLDQDGWLDLYCGNGDSLVGESWHKNQLFRNQAGKDFRNVTTAEMSDGGLFSQGIAVGDVNRDGFPDMVVANYGQNYLLVNQGDGSFDKRALGRVEDEPKWSTGCIMVDLDGDGDRDIVMTCYVDWSPEIHHPCPYNGVVGYCGPGTYASTHDLIYENLGDDQFREVHVEAGMDFPTKGLVVAAADFDQDRKPEVYVGSDLTPNAFYRVSEQGLKLENVANLAGVAVSKNGAAEATMGLALQDFDQNGQIDLFLTHYYQNKNTMYLNQGKGSFLDASFETRIKYLSFDSIGFGTAPIDYDRDSDFDLFVSNGHVLGEHIPPFFFKPQFLNNHEGRFYDTGEKCGGYFEKKFAGRGVAVADFDNDGDADIAVGHLDSPLALLENEDSTLQNYIQFELLSTDRSDLVGTEVVVQWGSNRVVLPVVVGDGYLSSSDTRLLVGVGQAKKVDVEIHWSYSSGGKVTAAKNLETNVCWILSTGRDPIGRLQVSQ
jgi:hypothetical protein